MKRLIVSAAVLAAFAMPASAEYTVKGSVECPDIVKEDGNENYREYNKWWLLGYFTARNYTADQTVGKGIENDNIYSMALAFCKDNPGNDWDDAAIHVYDLLD
ncbi:MAG: hypothetical protein AAGJ28_09245 [Pseudomonadota bacterium]